MAMAIIFGLFGSTAVLRAHHTERTDASPRVEPGDGEQGDTKSGSGASGNSGTATAGQGRFVFRLVPELSSLPAGAETHERGLHGGFAVDRRAGRGEVYFGLKGAGLIRVSSDLKERSILNASKELAGANLHNCTIFYSGDRKDAFLALPSNDRRKVFITDLQGAILRILENPRHNEYYRKGGAFVPCDTEVAEGVLYVVTGYSPGDYCVTANPFTGHWLDAVFGGKGNEHGKFGTAHGITLEPGRKLLVISDRPNSREEKYSYRGEYRETVELPRGSLPCDIDFHPLHPEVAVIGCLDGPDRKKGAPIYILEKDKIISTVIPREDLGVARATHLHNVVWKIVPGKNGSRETYLICQAWNPGKYFVLQQVKQN